ncbi:MAG TPA: DUF6134 family protein [Dongiaceae bacterium]|nr:DUF6134 family protein [Dongiaceae bacterium]
MLPFFMAEDGLMLPRRKFLAAGIVGAVGCAVPGLARAATKIVMPVAAGDRRFTILYKGDKIGAHTVLYSSEIGETLVVTDISLLVKVAFFTAFRFTHRSSETWRDDRLVSLTSVTVEHGETLHVDGRETPQGFRVESKGGPFIAPPATLTSNSLWTPAVLEQETVVDAQHGGVIGISARKFAAEQIVIGGRKIPVTRYTFITPYLAGSIWYDQDSLWVRGEFELDGSKIQYELDT